VVETLGVRVATPGKHKEKNEPGKDRRWSRRLKEMGLEGPHLLHGEGAPLSEHAFPLEAPGGRASYSGRHDSLLGRKREDMRGKVDRLKEGICPRGGGLTAMKIADIFIGHTLGEGESRQAHCLCPAHVL
jgi:hypothetical protein